MRIVFMFTCFNRSGAAKMMAWVANQMAEQGHEVHLLSYFSDVCEQPLMYGTIFDSLAISRSTSWWKRNTIGMARTLKAVHSYLSRVEPDVVVTFLDSVGYLYLMCNSIDHHFSIVASERADPYKYHGFKGKLRTWLMKKADGFVFQTEGARQFYKHYPKIMDNSVVIPNPVVVKPEIQQELDDLRVSAAQRERRIVSVGRLELRQKRQDVLLRAFALVLQQQPEATLHFYGNGSAKAELEMLARELKIEKSVFFEGTSAQIERNIYNARVFAMSSDFEGIPNALIEAMVLGVPSVSTDCSPGGARLIIQDGENGFLVPCGDYEALAEKMLVLLSDDALANRFSGNAVAVEKKFSETIIREQWLQTLSKYASKKKG